MNAEISARVGIAVPVPSLETATAPATAASVAADGAGIPNARPAMKAASNASPAPVVSRTVTGNPGCTNDADGVAIRAPSTPRLSATSAGPRASRAFARLAQARRERRPDLDEIGRAHA